MARDRSDQWRITVSFMHLHLVVSAGWLAVVLGSLGGRLIFVGSAPSVSEGLGWLGLSAAGAAAAWSVFRSAPTTSTQVLCDTGGSPRPAGDR
jgi:hypothetical protein